MMRNHLCCSAPVLLMLLGPLGALAGPCQWGEECVCLHCPAGKEPTTACSEVEGPDVVVKCRRCPLGTFSDADGPDQCRPITACRSLNRWTVTPPTSHSDAKCGSCLPGFHPAAQQKDSALRSCEKTSLKRLKRNAGKSAPHGSGVGVANATNVHSPEEKNTEYAVFALVPIFCVMGLLGILICNLLKKKGIHCTAEKEAGDEEAAMPQKEGNPCPYIVEDPNEDTISVLVRLITEKKENAAALEELLMEYERKQMAVSKASSIKFPVLPHLAQFRSLPRLCTHQHHLHTINGLAPRSGLCCSRCSQKKWPELLLPPLTLTNDLQKTPCNQTKPPTPTEGTILSVGRFQVAQIQEGNPVSVTSTPVESSDTDSVESGHTEPAEERSLLGLSVSSHSASSKSRQEMSE
ncbi:tumor necrosis factor receptor superfamily member 19L [Astyanax mexicanus]|uniref:tumor necrosis factor receptor superfamily member 19L n=1 Tax=Astyanax mexicanus TaxID=7994 RepID=UPI0020CB59CA|nr:tumor necrosis factor receptor superfamily member 19L [Astyanax mexicanus]